MERWMKPVLLESRVKPLVRKPSMKSPKMKCRVKTIIGKPRMEPLEKISWMMKSAVVKSRVTMKAGAPMAKA